MTDADRYFMWVEWSQEDDAFLGRCPDVITGIHGDDPVRLYAELRELVAEVLDDMRAGGEPLPEPTARPLASAA